MTWPERKEQNRRRSWSRVTRLAGGGPEPVFIGEEPGKVLLTSGGAFRIAHEEAERVLGWRPLVDMEEGLRRLIAWREGNEARG